MPQNNLDDGSALIREKNTRTSGFAGLFLMDAYLNDTGSAQDTPDLVEAAQNRVLQHVQYYSMTHKAFSVSKNPEPRIADVTHRNPGTFTDAEIAVESARLVALRVKEKNGLQSLKIANAKTRFIMSLFR